MVTYGNSVKFTINPKHAVCDLLIIVNIFYLGGGSLLWLFPSFAIFAVFSAISGLELSMSKEQHKCKFPFREKKKH